MLFGNASGWGGFDEDGAVMAMNLWRNGRNQEGLVEEVKRCDGDLRKTSGGCC